MSVRESYRIKKANNTTKNESRTGQTQATVSALVKSEMALRVFAETQRVSDSTEVADISGYVPSSTTAQFDDATIELFSASEARTQGIPFYDLDLQYKKADGSVDTSSAGWTTWIAAYNANSTGATDWTIKGGYFHAGK